MSAHDSRERAVEEATAAGLQISCVAPTVYGWVGNWSLRWSSQPSLWTALPRVGNGMPYVHALYLYDKPMPGARWGIGPLIAGEVIRPVPYERPKGVVSEYQITGVAGLCIFADYVRRPGLTEAVIRSEA